MSQTVSQRKVFSLPKLNLALIIGTLSVLLALVASFVLASWAESSSFAHGVQHVLLFTAGIGAGTSLTLGIKIRKDQ